MPTFIKHQAKEETPEPPNKDGSGLIAYEVFCHHGDKMQVFAVNATKWQWDWADEPSVPCSLTFLNGKQVVASFNRDQLIGFKVRGA